ncbi:hypothetical protein [Demequina maris]|nr:hypothetical protein [Demequina maris]
MTSRSDVAADHSTALRNWSGDSTQATRASSEAAMRYSEAS